MKPVVRPHRFPPLGQVHLREQLAERSPASLQAVLADGFQEGLTKGYEEGYASGLSKGCEDARVAAHDQGLAQGRAEMHERFGQVAKPVDALLDALQQLQMELQATARKEVVELVEKVARQVIRVELTLQPAQLLALVDETLASMPISREGVEVYLNAEDLRRITELAPERAAQWTLKADVQLASGECRLRAGGHEADAGCQQRLAACMEQVKAKLGEVSEQHAGIAP
jgi:flagellar assembly protein FliH